MQRIRSKATLLIVITITTLLACTIEEDLTINSDGSGAYIVRIIIPRKLGEDFTDLKREAARTGFAVVDEGKTERQTFLVLRKDFNDVASISDANSPFELRIDETGFLRRRYQFKASLPPIGLGSYVRQLSVRMPGSVLSSNRGEVEGSHVRLDMTRGGTLEITSSGYYLPGTRRQKYLLFTVFMLGVGALVASGGKRRKSPVVCNGCKTALRSNARFCPGCGNGLGAAQT